MKKRTWRAVALAICFMLPLGAIAGNARNVILLIGDGMGPGQFGAGWIFSKRALGKDLRMVELMKQGHTAYIVNDTADAIVTESAAAASQMATGQRMTVGTISMAADGKTPLKTILEIAQDKGMATGLVTTSGITDATPAAFASHVANRANEASVAEQELQHRVDVLLGGRRQFFLPESAGGKRQDGRDLIQEAAANAYSVATNAAELQAAKGPRLLGLFNMSNMSYELDRAGTQEPSLAEMSDKALQVLSASKKGFFLMIEGGRIDHAAHANDAAATIREVLAFDQAVGVAIDYAKTHPGTLVLVTADHETGGLALIGRSKTSSPNYVGLDVKAIGQINASFDVIRARMGSTPTADSVKAAVKEYMAIELTDDEANTVASDTLKTLDPANYGNRYLHSLAFVLRPYLRIGFASQTHTATPLYLFGSGPGAEKVAGFLHNTELFGVIRDAIAR